MQTENKFVDDLARLASGAVGTIGGVKKEVEGAVRARLDRLLGEMDLVTREEHEVALEMVRQMRAENERLEARVGALEKRATSGAKKPRARSKKAASKKS